MNRKLYQLIASTLQTIRNCETTKNHEWHARHNAALQCLVRSYMPSGSGVDNGTKLDAASTPDKLIFLAPYHHMNDGGYYDGWTDHSVVATASLTNEIDLRITGRNRNDIKDYLHDIYHSALTQDITQEQHARACGVDVAEEPLFCPACGGDHDAMECSTGVQPTRERA